MKILIEAMGIGHYGGARTATSALIRGLIQYNKDHEFIVLVSQPEQLLTDAPPNFRQLVVPVRNRFLSRIWAQLMLPRIVAQQRVELVHFAKNLTVGAIPVPTIVTVYDLTILNHPEFFPSVDVLYWRAVQPACLRSAHRIIAISNSTAEDLTTFYNLPVEAIRVIYPALPVDVYPATAEAIAAVWKHHNLRENIILHVGSFAKKKNISTLLKAFALLRKTARTDLQLVLAGSDYRKDIDLALYETLASLKLGDAVRVLGTVPDSDLPALSSGARIVANISLHEGFGLSALEALACGATLLISAGGALPELAGDAAMVVREARDPWAVADAMTELLNGSVTADRIRQRARSRAQLFSLERNARQTLDVYCNGVSGNP